MKKLILVVAACLAPVYAAQAQQVTYNWTTTSQGFGTHVDQPSSASFEVPLSAVLSGQINYGDISNIHFAYAGITFDSYTPTSNGLDNAAFVDPTTGAFIFHDLNQGLGVVGYEGGLFSGTFLSITIDDPYGPLGNPLSSVSDGYNALKDYAPYAGFPTSGFWAASFPTITPSVPEPATWAMMLLGFGGIGFAMRRRRRNGAALQLA